MATTAEAHGDVCSERCGSRRVLDLVADKWAVIVIDVLSRGTRRFGELQRAVGGVSQKMLTHTLRGLERDGLVERKVYPEVPPRVEYTLSPLGETLVQPLSALCRWAEEHFREVEHARERMSADAAA